MDPPRVRGRSRSLTVISAEKSLSLTLGASCRPAALHASQGHRSPWEPGARLLRGAHPSDHCWRRVGAPLGERLRGSALRLGVVDAERGTATPRCSPWPSLTTPSAAGRCRCADGGRTVCQLPADAGPCGSSCPATNARPAGPRMVKSIEIVQLPAAPDLMTMFKSPPVPPRGIRRLGALRVPPARTAILPRPCFHCGGGQPDLCTLDALDAGREINPDLKVTAGATGASGQPGRADHACNGAPYDVFLSADRDFPKDAR